MKNSISGFLENYLTSAIKNTDLFHLAHLYIDFVLPFTNSHQKGRELLPLTGKVGMGCFTWDNSEKIYTIRLQIKQLISGLIKAD